MQNLHKEAAGKDKEERYYWEASTQRYEVPFSKQLLSIYYVYNNGSIAFNFASFIICYIITSIIGNFFYILFYIYNRITINIIHSMIITFYY